MSNIPADPRWPLPHREELPDPDPTLIDEYERRTSLLTGWRDQLVRLLSPGTGDTVIDVGCGTGANFAALRNAVGARGTIIGVEESPELIAVAARRVTRAGWDNIELINSTISTVTFPVLADAALFCEIPDVLGSPRALANVLGQLRPGAGVGAGGWQYPVRPAGPLRAVVDVRQRKYLNRGHKFEPPWSHLARLVPDLEVKELAFGSAYLAHRPTRVATGGPR
jgi:SAM-dependent methyltransferase